MPVGFAIFSPDKIHKHHVPDTKKGKRGGEEVKKHPILNVGTENFLRNIQKSCAGVQLW